MTDGPYRGGKVHVLEEQCSTCVFRPGNLMRLAPGRLKDLQSSNVDAGSALTCHQTLPYSGTNAPPSVCRGFYDAYRDDVQALQLADRLGVIEFD